MGNLDFIEQHKSDDGPYEVTQLINSFLGALAHPFGKSCGLSSKRCRYPRLLRKAGPKSKRNWKAMSGPLPSARW